MKTITKLRQISMQAALFVAIAGCAGTPVQVTPQADLSEGHLSEAQLDGSAVSEIPQLPDELAPPPVSESSEDLYSIVVTDMPARNVLFALARDARVNIDVHPTIEGNLTLNAIDQTLIQILDRITRQIDVRYRVQRDVISVIPDTPYIASYDVNYLNMTRSASAEVSIATEVSSTGAGAGDESASEGEANISNTKITNVSRNYFWDSLLDNLDAILRGGDSNFTGSDESDSGGNEIEQEDDGTSIIANRETGIVTVRASRKQHLEIERYIDEVSEHAERQVLIEATIAEVTLNDRYQAGVDWERVGSGTGFSFNQALTATNLSSNPFFNLTYNNVDSGGTDWSSTVKMLNQFGDTKVLSSPKLMVLNNQTAVLKVVENKVYFSSTVEIEEGETNNDDEVTVESQIHTVPVGFVMSVTPQISADKFVTINARPTISRITGFARDPGPLIAGFTNVENLVPEIQVREIESILKIPNGAVGIIGGLMQDSIENASDGVPGLAKIPLLGNLFQYRDDQRKKTELVIFIRPVVIENANVEGDLSDYRQYLAHTSTDAQ